MPAILRSLRQHGRQGRPTVERSLPVITTVPDKSNLDQYGAYMYYQILKSVSEQLTINQPLNEKSV